MHTMATTSPPQEQQQQVYLLFDARMALHHPVHPNISTPKTEEELDNWFPHENPNRICRNYKKLLTLEHELLEMNKKDTNHNHRTGSTCTATDAGGVPQDCPPPCNGVIQTNPLQNRTNSSSRSCSRSRRRFIELPCLPADRKSIELVHTSEHYDRIKQTLYYTNQELEDISIPNDLYFNKFTYIAAKLACGGVIQCVNAVTTKTKKNTSQKHQKAMTRTKPTRAIALIRPPGHHALKDQAMGFCYFNNIAVAAKHAIHSGRAKRVFILDWDIHHGNGIQELTYDDPNIFYLSIHRGSFRGSSSSSSSSSSPTTQQSQTNTTNHNNRHYTKKKQWFYPGTGRYTEVGIGAGAGTNLNIVWGQGGMGNVEYAAAFREVVLPLLSSYLPDLIIVASGFDAVKGDLLGDCGLSPDMYYKMTKSLLSTAELGPSIPIVVAMEGGYNLDVSAECMEQVALALLDEPSSIIHEIGGGDVHTDVDDDSFWNCTNIPPKKRKIIHINHQNDDHDNQGLENYWNHEQFSRSGSAISKKATRLAVASIKRSRKALGNTGHMSW